MVINIQAVVRLYNLYGASIMNMISTGAFLTEMDASNKQSDLVSKLVRAWEKKNAKVAKAGGVSLMALSLAACGSSDDTSTTATDTTTVTTPTTPTITDTDGDGMIDSVDAFPNDANETTDTDGDGVGDNADKYPNDASLSADPATKSLTVTDGDVVTGTAATDTISAVISGTASKNTYDATDAIVDGTSDDSDVLTVDAGADATNTPSVNGIETVKFNVTGLSSSGTGNVTDFNADLKGLVIGTAVEFDVTNASSIVTGLVVTNDNGGSRTISEDFTSMSFAMTADADAVLDVNAVGNSASLVGVTVTGTGDELTVDAAGYVNVTAGAVTDLISVTSVNDATITDAGAAAALIVNAGGDVSVLDANVATYASITAGGKVAVTADKLDAAISPTIVAGETVSVDLKAATSINVTGAKTITISDDATADALLLVNATVKTEKTTIDLTGTDVVATVVVSGDQDAVVKVDAAALDGLTGDKMTITDSLTAGNVTLDLSTTSGNADMSANAVDLIDVTVDNNAKTVTVVSGQAVNIAADQTDLTIAGKAATATSNTTAITMNDGVTSAAHGATAVDLTALTLSNIATATMDVSQDKLLAGTAETHDITAITGNGADLTMTAGANNVALLGAVNLGATSTLTVTGTGKVTGNGSEAITAKTIDMSGVSGVVTLLEIESEETSSVTTGSGADVLELTDSGTEADIVIKTGAGNDQLTLTDTDTTEGHSLTIDMGDGTDTLVFVISQQILPTGTDTVTVTGVENLTYTFNATDADINSTFFNNQAFSLKDAGSGAQTFTLDVNASDTAIDLSKMTVTTANASAVAADIFVVDASGAGDDGITSIKGALVTKNTITGHDLDTTTIIGGNKADTLNGGALADTITGGEGADTIMGNAGADVIDLAETTAAVDHVQLIITSNGKDTIKNFNTASDKVDLEGGATGADSAVASAVAATLSVALTSGAAAYDIASGIAATDHIGIIGTALSSHGDLDAATDGTELLKALSATSVSATQITTDSGAKQYIGAHQDGNFYVFETSSPGNVNLLAAEIALVAVIEGATTGTITGADFAVI
jgi:hypothetical protein